MTSNPPDDNPFFPKANYSLFWYMRHRKPVQCKTEKQYLRVLKKIGGSFTRKIRKTYINDFMISTVFLSIDHSLDGTDNRPILFETMVFSVNYDYDYCTRCATHREALAMHWTAVNEIKQLTR